jgi:hypothetical protein
VLSNVKISIFGVFAIPFIKRVESSRSRLATFSLPTALIKLKSLSKTKVVGVFTSTIIFG